MSQTTLKALRHGLLCLLLSAPAVSAQQWVLTPAQRQALGIELGPAKAAEGLPLDGLPARVMIAPDAAAVVTVPFAGVVAQVLVREGATVRHGEPLARLQSREAMSLAADLAAARSQQRVAAAQAARDRALLAEGIIPAARAQASAAQAEAAAARWRELETAAALAPPAAGAPGLYELRAPVDGRVIERTLLPGAAVEPLAKAFVIARGSQVLVELRVPARHAAALRPGLVVRLADGHQGRLVEAAGAVDPGSQSVPARAIFTDAPLLPGQQLAVTLWLPAPSGAVMVPTSALAEREGGNVVFVADNRGFSAVPVRILAQTVAGQSVVTGVQSGATVVVAGAGALSALPAAGH
ncbi:efflux RND transporter periplasmic adaptor subunit [Aerosticca soli]|uniref:Probable Co/Zn/Cd efflux system membrane fusion protein n=1 Tax=Aerosticca soli TaxID=2010829 RepID=A0A2Z6E288_9GAMM|nr:efflux RND transporter periplasmic adaptor subunit [Aerosticca soli]BBD79062.1 probable Co/Zn/Cd efflux system membrane fusion protein [Aerosticca soli]